MGKGGARSKRKDLRFYGSSGKVVLCGEVKLPGQREGQSPYDVALCSDAAAKADNANVRYFFTWNVNTFVLWDRSLWDVPLLERRVWERKCPRSFSSPEEIAREENLEFIKTRFLPDLLRDLADIVSGRKREWLPPDDIFIRSLESHLDWPVQLASAYIRERTEKQKSFDLKVQGWMSRQDWTFVRTPHEEWASVVDNMAKTLAYVWANRLIFYKALRTRFPELPKLELRPSVATPAQAVEAFNALFQKAVLRSGDYEPLLMPKEAGWDTELVFHPPHALDAWRGLLRGIESVDFREVPSDVVGRIFQKLIGPEERHRYGQHFTGDDAVDLINSFCIRRAEDVVLDPACGSGSFLVRAYYRKRYLQPRRAHLDLLGELFGCDIALYPAHLATLNLAAREINDEANYPRIWRRNFFDFDPRKPFCTVPDGGQEQREVYLPPLDAVVGNPPYVRQEKIDQREKQKAVEAARRAWADAAFSGRSDLHCYFWPAAARFLKPDGYFGFLTSSSWLDVEYGFALQAWILRHFRILAIMESGAEPWFEDARVKTCITILQRCDDEAQRMSHRVRFVRFHRKLADILGTPAGRDEAARQSALEALRRRILAPTEDYADDDLRIIVKTQQSLWEEGVKAGAILRDVQSSSLADDDADNGEEEAHEEQTAQAAAMNHIRHHATDGYAAGKWGRYVRAPDVYFEFHRRFASKFVALGDIAIIRRGVTSGCDAFFMPKDVTAQVLRDFPGEKEFRQHAGGAPRKDVVQRKLKIVQAGDGSVHPIESRYLRPELHSLMKVDRPVVRATDLDRVILLVREPLYRLKSRAVWTWRYLRYGMTATFASKKSKAVPLPQRSTCAARDPWYDLTKLVRPGIAFWPMAQQYRHIVAANPERLICNHNLFDIAAPDLSAREQTLLVAVLNSTLVALFKTFYGRYAGTEGNLKTEVIDVNLLEVPDPRGVSPQVAQRLADALARMSNREVGRLVEEQLMECHSPERARRLAAQPLAFSQELLQPDRRDLDDAVLELLGVADRHERDELLARLYEATARHFREIRVLEIEKMEQRAKSKSRKFTAQDLAADIWDAAELEDSLPLREWMAQQPECTALIIIPSETPAALSKDMMFSPNVVYFGKQRATHMECTSRGQAELVERLANLGISGEVRAPLELTPSLRVLDRLNARLTATSARFQQLTESRTGDERLRASVLDLLMRWFAVGRTTEKTPGAMSMTEEAAGEAR